MKSLLIVFLLFISFNGLAQIYAHTYNSGAYMSVRKKPKLESREISRINSGDSVQLLSYSGDQYYKVRTCAKDSITGYLNIYFLKSDSVAVNIVNKYNSDYFIDKRLEYTPLHSIPSERRSSSSYSGSGGRTSVSKSIQTGPRGGKYYINSHGKKTYVKRK